MSKFANERHVQRLNSILHLLEMDAIPLNPELLSSQLQDIDSAKLQEPESFVPARRKSRSSVYYGSKSDKTLPEPPQEAGKPAHFKGLEVENWLDSRKNNNICMRAHCLFGLSPPRITNLIASLPIAFQAKYTNFSPDFG